MRLARERKVLLDAILVGFMHRGRATQIAAALGILGLRQMAFACAGAQNFSLGRELESLGYGLFRLNAFWTSHKNQSTFFQKERAI
jgi:hypothetical protein